jgi:Peptidase A4 family
MTSGRRTAMSASGVAILALCSALAGASPAQASGPGGPGGPNTLSGFSTDAFPADSYGTLTTTITIPTYSMCEPGEDGETSVSLSWLGVTGGTNARTVVGPGCDDGVLQSINAEPVVTTAGRQEYGPSLTVAPGDTVKSTITDHAPNGSKKGILSATVQDITKGSRASIGSYASSGPLDSLEIGQAIEYYTPTFSSIRFTNTFFQGKPFAATPGLTESVVDNKNGKPLVAVSGPSSDGKNFTLIFRRNGPAPDGSLRN